MISRNERKELDALSKEVFGSASRWQKLVNKGYEEALMEEKFEDVPADEKGEGGGTKAVQVPVKATASGGVKYVRKYHTEETIKEYMLQTKKHFEEIRAQIKKHQDDIAAQKAEDAKVKKLNDENAGSAT